MNAALGDVSEGVFFDFADRRSGHAQVDAGVFGPRGVALASYHITESQAVLPGAATHIKFERPLAGAIYQRHGQTELAAGPATSILSGPGDCEMFWRPNGQVVHSISMSLPVSVLKNFLAMAGCPYSVGTEFVTFEGARAAQDAQFTELMSYILRHFARLVEMPRQGDLAEALLLETFVDMSLGVGFLNGPETAGVRRDPRRVSADACLVARAEEYIRANFHESLTMPQVAKEFGVSLRKLQMAFRERRGVTPRKYLSMVRLEHARMKLLRPGLRGNVTTVANDCGIVHLGRFSKAYLEAFGEYPLDTLYRSLREC